MDSKSVLTHLTPVFLTAYNAGCVAFVEKWKRLCLFTITLPAHTLGGTFTALHLLNHKFKEKPIEEASKKNNLLFHGTGNGGEAAAKNLLWLI